MNQNFPAGQESIDNISEFSEEAIELSKVFGMSLDEAERELREHYEEWHKEEI